MTLKRYVRYGRETLKGKFIALPHNLMDSAAFQSLSVYSIVALIQFMRRFNGHNNGNIICTVCNLTQTPFMGRSTAHKCIRELETKGFIVKTTQGAFTTRQATTWELTMVHNKGENRPSNKWKEWRPGDDFTNRETVPFATHIPRKN